jgi:hypothetical protein
MDKRYLRIWELAKPYYQKGRSYDIPHIEWMIKEADKIADLELLNKDLLLPIIILHDVGYSIIEESNQNIKSKESKKIHMKESAKIAKQILSKIDYPRHLIKKITYYISVHDNWLFGDDKPYQECKEMAVFNDLDFLWVTTSFNTFKITAESMGMNPREFYEFWSKDEKLDKRPFCCDYTRKMWKTSMENIKKLL